MYYGWTHRLYVEYNVKLNCSTMPMNLRHDYVVEARTVPKLGFVFDRWSLYDAEQDKRFQLGESYEQQTVLMLQMQFAGHDPSKVARAVYSHTAHIERDARRNTVIETVSTRLGRFYLAMRGIEDNERDAIYYELYPTGRHWD